MVKYDCIRCGYTTDFKSNMKCHLNRKNKCMVKTGTDNTPLYSVIVCEYCDKIYTYQRNLTKHLKTCKMKKDRDKADEQTLAMVNILNSKLSEYKTELDSLKIEMNNQLIVQNAQTINNNNNQINIQMDSGRLGYAHTNYDVITDADIKRALNRSSQCLHFIVKITHFNENHPENQNVYINCLKSSFVMVFNGTKWEAHTWSIFSERFIGNNMDTLQEWICVNGDKYPELAEKFNRFMDQRNNDKFDKTIRDAIRLILYNNREYINSPAMIKCLNDLQKEKQKESEKIENNILN